jgi:hypothetical protein
MAKVHGFVPLTEQEEQVRDVLLQHGVTHMPHAVFPVKNRTYVVDFYLCDQRIILECWKSGSRRGVALGWIERNAAYVDLKFKRIKGAYPENRFIALVEVVHAQPDLVREYAGPVLEHADVLCCTMEEFGMALRQYCEVGQLGGGN